MPDPDPETARHQLPLAGQAAIVTGSGRGIGAACAIHLAELGADVVLNYLHDADSAAQVRTRIQSLGRRATVVGADVGTADGAQSLAAAASAEFGRLDILVSNAGPLFRAIPLIDMSWDDFGSIVTRDTQAAFFSTKAVLPAMIAQRRGRIVYIGSTATHRPSPGVAHHGSARAAVTTFAAYVAREMGQYGITANVVAPGMVRTDRTAALGDMIARLDAMTPAGRIATPADVARAVGFLAADAEGFYTGVNFPVDGGLSAG